MGPSQEGLLVLQGVAGWGLGPVNRGEITVHWWTVTEGPPFGVTP